MEISTVARADAYHLAVQEMCQACNHSVKESNDMIQQVEFILKSIQETEQSSNQM